MSRRLTYEAAWEDTLLGAIDNDTERDQTLQLFRSGELTFARLADAVGGPKRARELLRELRRGPEPRPLTKVFWR